MSPVGQVLVEEYLAGWQEHELEVMCDARGNAVVVCSIENLDPMGVHTGDSWTIAPQQTLPDPAYQRLREAAFATARAVGVATGGANVQFAVHPEANEFRVIEMNPRVSRSSALASKATGFPIAKLAALLAVGFTLDELPNDITGKTTAAFEPALDYVAVKAPRFDFEKFPRPSAASAPRCGRSARRSARPDVRRGVPQGARGTRGAARRFPAGDEELLARAAEPVPERWDLLLEAARRGLEPPGIHPYFADRLRGGGSSWSVAPDGAPRRLAVDSCAGEFEARTPYYYVTHEGDDEGPEPSGRAVVVLGGGPNRIGQAIEFDYCCVHAAQALRKLGYEAVLVNSNPETVSTDYDTSDRLYLEPLVEQRARRLRARAARRRRRLLRGPDAAAAGAGARRGRRAAARRPARAIDAAEDRGRFARSSPAELAPSGAWPTNARRGAGGRGADRLPGARPPAPRDRRPRHARRARGRRAARRRARASSTATSRARSSSTSTRSATARTRGSPRCSSTSSRPASTRATRPACCPGPSVSAALEDEIREIATRIAAGLGARGLINLQLAVAGGKLWVLEANPRASRTVPFVAKATGVPLVEHAVRLLLGERLDALGLPERAVPTRAWAKEAVFPAERFAGAARAGPRCARPAR